MASALMELMGTEVKKYAEQYAEDCVRENRQKIVKAMIQNSYDNSSIKLIIDITDDKINELRKNL